MKFALLLSALVLALGVLAQPFVARAATYGSAAEAAALLDKAIVELKADPVAAVDKFNNPAGAFRDRDLYVFCASETTGKITAHANLVGTDLRTLKDKNGKPFGAEMFATAREGEIGEVTYMWPRPDGGDPVGKVSRITKIGDLMCGVGYYTE
jgi:hypothetical protein